MGGTQMQNAGTGSVAQTAATPSPVAAPSFIVLGRDEGGKAHASWFEAADRDAAERAAGLMGMHGLAVDDDGLAAIARRLPRGKLFASGRAFVPFVKGSTFDQLAARLPMSALTRPVRATPASNQDDAEGAQASVVSPAKVATGTGSTATPKGGSAKGDGNPAGGGGSAGNGGGSGDDGQSASRPAPRDWGSLAAGDTVLALDTPDEGWWEAVVVEVREGELVLLRWRDFPETPTFSRRRTAIALLHPDRNKV